jgi:hypothetical protein
VSSGEVSVDEWRAHDFSRKASGIIAPELTARPPHRSDWRPQAKFTQSAEHFDVIVKTAFAQLAPGNVSGGVAPQECFSFWILHDVAHQKSPHPRRLEEVNGATGRAGDSCG